MNLAQTAGQLRHDVDLEAAIVVLYGPLYYWLAPDAVYSEARSPSEVDRDSRHRTVRWR